jgi:8-amino-7-oxononanoate synthase
VGSSALYIEKKLAERQAAGNYRTLKPESSLIDFCSNDYLGFSHSTLLKNRIDEELDKNKTALNGSTGSRLISGNLKYTEDLEKQLSVLFNSDAGLLFNSGYDANVGLFSSLPQRGDTIITDELIHASIIDGARLSYANRYIFKHNDLESLESKLKQAKGICYVVIESVYSMDGDTPPITSVLNLTEKYGAHLIVDEAHAVGLHHTGIITQLKLENRIFARIVTFGKALGCHGAIILGSNLLREYLINFARSFIYTTSAPFHQLVSIKMACELLQQSENTVDALKDNISLFKKGINTSQTYPLINSESAIQCILLNNNEAAGKAAAWLQNNGLDVRAIRSPTVAAGSERIRICLHSFNTTSQVNLLTQSINNFIYAL